MSSCICGYPVSSQTSTPLLNSEGEASDNGVGGKDGSALLQSEPTEEKSSCSCTKGKSIGVDGREPGREADEDGAISVCLTAAMVFLITATSKLQLHTSCSAASWRRSRLSIFPLLT